VQTPVVKHVNIRFSLIGGSSPVATFSMPCTTMVIGRRWHATQESGQQLEKDSYGN
jgi:hypothetical protein